MTQPTSQQVGEALVKWANDLVEGYKRVGALVLQLPPRTVSLVKPEPVSDVWSGDVIMADIKAKVRALATCHNDAEFDAAWPEIEDMVVAYADRLLDVYLNT